MHINVDCCAYYCRLMAEYTGLHRDTCLYTKTLNTEYVYPATCMCARHKKVWWFWSKIAAWKINGQFGHASSNCLINFTNRNIRLQIYAFDDLLIEYCTRPFCCCCSINSAWQSCKQVTCFITNDKSVIFHKIHTLHVACCKHKCSLKSLTAIQKNPHDNNINIILGRIHGI